MRYGQNWNCDRSKEMLEDADFALVESVEPLRRPEPFAFPIPLRRRDPVCHLAFRDVRAGA